ncbi:MAG: hypothetical protein ACKO34_00595 [Vampirovibrionales bacterium]
MKTARMLVSVMALAVLGSGGLSALAATPDEEFLIRKGYSPETTDIVGNVRSRVEWKEIAPPKRSSFKQFIYNVIHNDPIGNVDEFGYGVIRRI